MAKRVTTIVAIDRSGNPRAVVTHVTSVPRARKLCKDAGIIGNDAETVPYHECLPRYGEQFLGPLRHLDCRKDPKLPPNYQTLEREFHPLKSIEQIPRPKVEQLQLIHWVPPA